MPEHDSSLLLGDRKTASDLIEKLAPHLNNRDAWLLTAESLRNGHRGNVDRVFVTEAFTQHRLASPTLYQTAPSRDVLDEIGQRLFEKSSRGGRWINVPEAEERGEEDWGSRAYWRELASVTYSYPGIGRQVDREKALWDARAFVHTGGTFVEATLIIHKLLAALGSEDRLSRPPSDFPDIVFGDAERLSKEK